MARFTVRVELHDYATGEEYAVLKTRLAAAKFVDYIQGDTGQWYRLPPAEYYTEGEVSGELVRDRAAQVAATVKPRYAVLVTEGPMRYWRGLEPIQSPI
jgi:hypothetical protein